MIGRILLDTNIAIAFLESEAGIRERVAEAADVWIPLQVYGELCYGAMASAKPESNLARIDAFIQKAPVLAPVAATGQI